MSYKYYKKIIQKKCNTCGTDCLNSFCSNIISRILMYVDKLDISDLWEREAELVKGLIEMVRYQKINWDIAGSYLDELSKIAKEDEIHAIHIHMELTEFLCAMDNWRDFQKTRDYLLAAKVSENMMNILDFYFVDNQASLDDWLSVKMIKDELSYQNKYITNQGLNNNQTKFNQICKHSALNWIRS